MLFVVWHPILWCSGTFILFRAFSHLVIDLSLLLFPLIPPSITSFSIPRSFLTTCPKYIKAACVAFDSSVHSGLMFSKTHTLFFLSIQDTLTTSSSTTSQMQQFPSCELFQIVQVSAPYGRPTIGNTEASFIFITSFTRIVLPHRC